MSGMLRKTNGDLVLVVNRRGDKIRLETDVPLTFEGHGTKVTVIKEDDHVSLNADVPETNDTLRWVFDDKKGSPAADAISQAANLEQLIADYRVALCGKL